MNGIRDRAVSAAAIALLILGPFFVFGTATERMVGAAMDAPKTRGLAFVLVTTLLAVDSVAPIPSSIVATLSGLSLGLAFGTIASWAGMTIGSAFGYAIGGGVFARLVKPRSSDARQSAKLSPTTIGMVAATRGIPVLAEAVTLLAGANRLPFIPFILTSALANLGVAAAYAWVGAKAASTSSFLLALAGSLLLPGVALLIPKLLKGRRTQT